MDEIGRFTLKNVAYLKEIRRKLLFAVGFFLVVFLGSFFMAKPIIKFFLKFFYVKDVQIVITSPFQFFGLSMSMALFLAIVASFPLIVFQIYYFLKPALTKKERKSARRYVFASGSLFLAGFVLGIALMRFVIEMLAKLNYDLGAINMWDINFFISQIMLTAALLGLMFQFPIVLTILIKTGMIDAGKLREKRHIAIASSFIFSSLLPPTDALSLIIMALPLILIYEITIFVNRKSGTRKVEAPRKVIM
ncbi:MAG: twin-arginine translocase subunit TatC [Candidatus Moranbacteria bacterium]|nr:twin-arginine translocase subunit TatC [Candidatus Moranbacteria bacterium]